MCGILSYGHFLLSLASISLRLGNLTEPGRNFIISVLQFSTESPQLYRLGTPYGPLKVCAFIVGPLGKWWEIICFSILSHCRAFWRHSGTLQLHPKKVDGLVNSEIYFRYWYTYQLHKRNM